MRKKCFVFLMFFSIFGLLFLFAGNAYASEGDANNVAQQTSSLYVNEAVTINVDGYDKVYVNNKLIEKNKTLSDSGYYYVKYVTKTTETQTIKTEEGPVSKEVEVYTETASEYYIVNIDVLDGEVYFEEKEINLALINNVSYYLNDELIEEDTVCTNEGSNALKIVCGDELKTISFDIFKFNNKEDLAGKNFTTLQTVEYTENTSAKILLNGEVFDGNITTFGNYNFIVYNTKNEEIGSLSFVIDVIVSINGVKYTAENATVELEKAISLSTYGKIEYSLEPLTQKLSGYNIYNGYVTYNPGQNTLNITGAGSYSLAMVFNVTPVTNIINNHSYTKEVLPIVSGGSVKINGYDFALGTTIKTAGSYEMVISGLESDAVATYHFTVLEEELNASNSTFAQALIAAKTNNYMLLNGTLYTSGDVVYKVGKYEFSIYYPTYEENDLTTNPYTDNKYIKSKYYNVVTYKFEIELGLNIVADTEYYDNVTILFSGAETANLEFEGETSSISSGYVASKVGNYILTFNENSYSFSVTPSLNVANAQVYLDSAMVLKSYDFDTNSSVTFKLTCETGTDTSNKETLTNSNVINKTLKSGSYSLTISTTYGYSKTINFIVVSSSTISRGAVYQNGKAFDINMYGVTPYLNSPATETRVRSTEKYKSTAIYTVGKHYMTFEFNGVTTSIDVDTAIYFYILPVVTIDGEVTTSKALSSDLEATLTFKDGTGLDIENDNFDCISLDSKSNQDQIVNNNSKYYFDEIGYHYIYLSLDGYSYTITLTINSYFYKDSIASENIVSSTSTETYLTTSNIYQTEVTFVNKENILSYKLDNTTDINGVTITEVGNHKLYLKGVNNYSKVLIFVIEENVLVNNEKISTVEAYENLIYTESVSFNIVGDATYLLDDKAYTSLSLIDTVGNHILTINGANNYSKNYKFQIKESLIVTLNNVEKNTFDTSYTEDFSFSINYDKISSVKLNGEALTAEINNITTIGNYKLTIVGTNSYTATYSFKVLPTLTFISSEVSDNSFASSYYDTVTPTLDNSKGLEYFEVTLNGEAYSFTEINTTGKYTLVLAGVGSYKETYTFTLKESVLYSFDGTNYSNLTSKITIDSKNTGKAIYLKKEYSDVLYSNISLNGNTILDESLADSIKINTLGDNELIINDNTYTISLREVNSILEESISLAKANPIDSLSEITFNDSLTYEISLDDNAYNNKAISSFGLHKVKVSGINYTNTYYFYINLNTNIENSNVYYTNVTITSNANDLKIYANDSLVSGSSLSYVGSYKVVYSDLYENEEIYNINLKANLKLNGNALSDVNTNELINITYAEGSNEYKSILLNGSSYSFETINTIGNNVLALIDINNNEEEYSLVINSDSYINSNAYTTQDLAYNNQTEEFTLALNSNYAADIYLDNSLAEANFTNAVYGLHKLTVKGVNGYSNDYYFAIKLLTNVANEEYDDSLTITCNGSYKVDGKEVSTINEVGNHTLTINKQVIDQIEEETIEFVIKETVSGFDKVNYNALTPVVLGNVSKVILSNVEDYKLGDLINKAGYYTLTIYGANDYVNTYEFSIIPTINYINYDFSSTMNTSAVYIEKSDVAFDLYVNGELFDIQNPIDTIGNNIVEIKGYDYSYKKTITLNEITNIGTEYNYSDNFVPVIANLNAQAIYLDGVEYDGLPITFFGNHVLTIEGLNDYKTNYSFKINLDTDLLNNEEYTKSFNIKANADIYVNGELSNLVYLIGNNVITFKGLNLEEEYTVTLKENISGYNLDQYKASNLLSFENVSGIILDDNKLLASNNLVEKEVNEVGNHTFKILGLNGYESSIYSFTIVESLPLLENANVFNNSVLINVENVSGLLLNGNNFENNNYVSLIGSYTLTVLGVNGYSNNYDFTITYNMTGIEESGIYVGKAIAICNNANMYVDGELYNSGDVIYVVGYHELVVKGNETNEVFTYKFTILPDLSNNDIINEYEENNVTINEAKAFYIDSKSELSLTLNGEAYNGDVISNVGNYELTLIGSNGYTKTYFFTVEPVVDNIELTYNVGFTPVIAKNLNYELYLNGEAYQYGTLINNVGNFKLEIKGVNYAKEYNFTITEDIYYKSNNEYVKLNEALTYDGLLLIKNNNNLIYKTVLNDNLVTNLTTINTVGNNVLVIVGENGYEATYNILLTEKLNIADEATFDDSDYAQPKIINNLVGKILIDGEELSTIQGYGKHLITVVGLNYESSYYVNINLNSNIKADESYVESKEININSKFMIDDVEYEKTAFINEVGIHNVTILGYGEQKQTFKITIKEVVSGISNDEIYNTGVVINVANAKLVLNGNEYASNTIVEAVGNHVLEVYGTNGYKNVYKFTINNKEFENNQILDQSLLINIPNATLYVDGELIENNSIITKVGYHTLLVSGLNNYSNEYQFTINNASFEDEQVVLGSLLINIPNATLYVDGEVIENNTAINEVGYHTLKVCGTNNYSNEYKFTITPDASITQTETEKGIIATITSNNVCQSIEIDDVYYEAGMSYSSIGNHTLTITGTNGYEYSVDFTVDASLAVNDDGVYNDKIVITTLDADEIILDGLEMTKDTVISNGTHTLTIIGSNGYEKTITFTYNNPNNSFVIICTIALVLVFITTSGIVFFMKKRKAA